MYQGSPWPAGNSANNPPTITNLSSSILGNTQTNNLLHSNLQHPPNILQLINNQTSIASTLASVLSQHQPPQLFSQLQQITLPQASTSATNTAGAFLLQQILAAKTNRSTPVVSLQSPRLGALQQHFAHNFSFTNSSSYHSQHKPPTPPRQPASPEDPAPIKSLYTKLQINVDQQNTSEVLSASPVLFGCNKDKTDASIDTEIDDKFQQEEVNSTDEDSFDMAFKSRSKSQKRTSDSSSPQSTKRHCSSDRSSVPLVPATGNGVPRVLNKNHYDEISKSIWDRYESHKQTEAIYDSKMKLREALFTVVKGVFPYCGLYIVGSSMNGFGSCTSDMDLCLMLSLNDLDQKTEATEILNLLFKAMKRCRFLNSIQLIRAKVPILKFSDSVSGVQCDLNVNNWVGIRNTHLLNAYSKAGCTPSVIPSLQHKFPSKFSREIDIRAITLNETLPQFVSPNDCNVGELFVGFLYYYNTFDFNNYGVSVRLGSKVQLFKLIQQNPTVTSQWVTIGIEEPFDLSNTARAVRLPTTLDLVKRVIRVSYSTVVRTGTVKSLFERPF